MPKDGELTKLMDWRSRGNCPTPQLIPATLRQPPPAEVSLDVVSFRGIRQWFPELLKPSYQNVPETARGDREKRGPVQGP